MDPNENLSLQRHLIVGIMAIYDACADDGTFTAGQSIDLAMLGYHLAELSRALDEWITGGGFLPTEWRKL